MTRGVGVVGGDGGEGVDESSMESGPDSKMCEFHELAMCDSGMMV